MAAAQIGMGAYQTSQGKKQREEAERNKPDYQIPDDIYANMSAAERLAYEGMPAAQKANFNKAIQRSQATMLSRSGELQQGLAGLAASTQAASDAAGNLAVEDARMRREGEKLLMAQRGVMAQYKDKAFNIKQSDYMYDRDAAEAMKGAGQQNIMSGLDTAAYGVGNAVGGGQRSTPQNQNIYEPGAMSYGPRVSIQEQQNLLPRQRPGEDVPFETSGYYFEPNIYGN